MKRIIFYILFLTANLNLNAQNEVLISFNSLINNDSLVLDKSFLLDDQKVQVSKLKFYISNVAFFLKEKSVYSEKNSFHLIDFEKKKSLEIVFKSKRKFTFDKVSFVLGIDSNTNHSGVKGGALDPTKGMYWAWQSGYINFKIEGQSESLNNNKHEFAFHLGGFLNGNNCAEKVQLFIEDNEKTININLNLSEFLKSINLKKDYKIMSPGEEAIYLSKEISKRFTIIENE
ncbi:MAG: hypothetical protein ACI8ZX_000774 [Planctomycetota bacterium]|jgi:hypothetical protein